MASSGAAEKERFHEGNLEPYAHEEHGRPHGVSETWYSVLSVDPSAAWLWNHRRTDKPFFVQTAW
jgi:hypothetical protein